MLAVRRPDLDVLLADDHAASANCIYLTPLQPWRLFLSLLDCIRATAKLRDIYARILWGGREGVGRRMKALLHTWLGAYLARALPSTATHIHANHGYFPAWAAMIASRLTGLPYSLTLHGSDLLVDRIYIDLKTCNALFVVTISDFNKRFLLDHVPQLPPDRVVVNRLGVDTTESVERHATEQADREPLAILTVGRLHAVKNQPFLLRACRRLADAGVPFTCRIVGSGPESQALAALIRQLRLENWVTLIGPLSGDSVAREYDGADLFVLTSRSEGLPNVLIEAMLHGLPVIAPAITGIPELVTHNDTGALYRPDDLDDLVAQIHEMATMSPPRRAALCQRARERVLERYDGRRNAAAFARLFDPSPRPLPPTVHSEEH